MHKQMLILKLWPSMLATDRVMKYQDSASVAPCQPLGGLDGSDKIYLMIQNK